MTMSMKLLLAALLGMILLASPAAAQVTAPAGFQLEPTVTGLTQGVSSVYVSDGRVFVAEKEGIVRVARADGTLDPTLVVDISSRVNNFNDRGMLGITADKDFATNGWLYLLYAYDLNPLLPDREGQMVSRLTRITVNPDNTVANPESPETVILGSYVSGPCPAPDNAVDCIPADYHWHTVGTLRTDPVDGTLWLGSGDASSGSVQQQAFRAQSEQSFAGKMIHIDRNGRGVPGHPFCQDEPDLTKVCTKLYAKGLRNPFRFTLRPGKGPVVGDVGHALQEEVDLLKPGRNYGWPCYEGIKQPSGYRDDQKCKDLYAKAGTAAGATPPSYSYDRPEDGGAAVGGPQITGTAYPAEYRNDIFFGDHVQGWIKRLKVDANDNVTSVEPFAEGAGRFVELETDPDGLLVMMDPGGFGTGEGAIRRFRNSSDLSPTARASATPTTGAAPLAVQFTGGTSSDPEGKALTYDWDFGDGTARGTTANPAHTYAANGQYTARLTVRDPAGQSSRATVTISVGNAPPNPVIVSPTTEDKFVAGSTVQLQAAGTDPEDGTLPSSAFTWQVILHHGTHLHQHASGTGATASFTTDGAHDADSYYEIRLTAKDSQGLTARTILAELRPKTVKFSLASSPPGAPVSYANSPMAPATLRNYSAVGFSASIVAAPSFVSGGRVHRFVGWSDGGARSHDVRIPNRPSALVANYAAADSATMRLTSAADTSVDSTQPDATFGAEWALDVDGDPVKQALLRFDVAGVAARRVTATRLRLYSSDPSSRGARVHRAAPGWTESTTWNTRPALLAQIGNFADETHLDEWWETPLADAVTGDGPLSLGLDTTTANGVDYLSRESNDDPTLTVEVEPRRASAASAPTARADFDGDGHEDLAIGVPEENQSPSVLDTGAVHVIYGGQTAVGARSQYWTQSSSGIAGVAEAGDAFGAGLAAGDFNGDGRADLAIGAPGDGIGAAEDAGVVHVLLGGASGLRSTGSQMWAQDSAYIADAPESGDAFGQVLAAGDVTGDGRADLAVGVPREDLAEGADAGAVHFLRGGSAGLAGSESQFFSQAQLALGETAEAGDELGGALAMGDFNGDNRADLAAAAPYEDRGGIADAGVVHVLAGGVSGLAGASTAPWSQASASVADDPEAGDRFGSVLAAGDFGGGAQDDLAIGVPDEDVGANGDAGIVHMLPGSASGLTAAASQRWYQGAGGLAGGVEAGDRFGQALAGGELGGGAKHDLVVGAPGDSVGPAAEAGVVHVMFGGAGGLAGAGGQLWTQNSTDIFELPETGDRLGASVAALNLTGGAPAELVVGVPGENVAGWAGAGAVHVLGGAAAGPVAAGSSYWTQNSTGVADIAERGDGFGGALSP